MSLVLVAIWLGSTLPAAQVRVVPSRPEPSPPADRRSATALAAALERALDEGWRDLLIEAECGTDGGFDAVELHGNGIGIWNREAQFQLPAASVRSMLEAFRAAGFAGMRRSFGGKGDPVVPVKQPPRSICQVALRLEGVRKQDVQLRGGRQSEELKGLANRILEPCREPGRSGVRASDLADGLAKLAGAELAAEAFHLVLHRKGPDPAAAAESWLLRVDGVKVSLAGRTGGGGWDEPLVLELPRDELSRLARQLSAAGLDELPPNLYAEQYTDLTVAVLGRRRQIQARRFAGLTASAHGPRQQRFDRLFDALSELKQRVFRDGRPVPRAARP